MKKKCQVTPFWNKQYKVQNTFDLMYSKLYYSAVKSANSVHVDEYQTDH